MALSADASTALVGGPTDAENRGAVWVFAASGSSYAQPGIKLVSSSAQGGEGHFGSSVALSGDGNRALVGAPREGGQRGAATEFERPGGGWSEVLPVDGSEATARAASGTGVALSGSGETALVGAPHDEAQTGSAWIFTFVPASAVPAPEVSSVAPKHGPTSGGTKVTIRGRFFTKAPQPTVTFGAQPATEVKVETESQIQVVSPPEPEGTVDVRVQTMSGPSAVTANDKFKYEAPSSGGGGGGPGGEEPTKTTTSKKEPSKGSAPSSSTSSGSSSPTPSVGVLGVSGAGSPACRVSLNSKHIAVSLKHSAAIRLLRTGAGQCRGTLTLRYRQKTKGKHFKLRTIGSARFAISPGKSQVVKVTLNKLGRKLFRAGHGKLNASVAVLRTTPAPTLAKTASVRLSVQKPSKRTPVKK